MTPRLRSSSSTRRLTALTDMRSCSAAALKLPLRTTSSETRTVSQSGVTWRVPCSACSEFGTPRSFSLCILRHRPSIHFLSRMDEGGEKIMTEHPLELLRSRGQLEVEKPRRLLTELNSERYSKHLLVFRPNARAVDDLVEKARAAIPGLTDSSVVHRVLRHNPDCMIAIARKRKFNP